MMCEMWEIVPYINDVHYTPSLLSLQSYFQSWFRKCSEIFNIDSDSCLFNSVTEYVCFPAILQIK